MTKKISEANGGPIVVGLDDGYAQVKILTSTGLRKVLPTRLSAGRSGNLTMDGPDGSFAFETEGRAFEVALPGAGEPTNFDGFHWSDLDRVAVHYGLHAAGLSGQDVDLVVGLPVGDYFRGDGAKDEDKIARKIDNLTRPVIAWRGLKELQPVNITRVRVVGQALATWLDWAFDDAGRSLQDPQASVGVIDVGGRTTDVTSVIAGKTVDGRASGSTNLGALDVYQLVGQAIAQQHRLRAPLAVDKAEQAVRTGTAKIFGESVDVSEHVRAAVAEVEGRIERYVSRLLEGRAADLDTILLVGGSAHLFSGLGNLWRNVKLVEDAEFANARGMLKRGMRPK